MAQAILCLRRYCHVIFQSNKRANFARQILQVVLHGILVIRHDMLPGYLAGGVDQDRCTKICRHRDAVAFWGVAYCNDQ